MVLQCQFKKSSNLLSSHFINIPKVAFPTSALSHFFGDRARPTPRSHDTAEPEKLFFKGSVHEVGPTAVAATAGPKLSVNGSRLTPPFSLRQPVLTPLALSSLLFFSTPQVFPFSPLWTNECLFLSAPLSASGSILELPPVVSPSGPSYLTRSSFHRPPWLFLFPSGPSPFLSPSSCLGLSLLRGLVAVTADLAWLRGEQLGIRTASQWLRLVGEQALVFVKLPSLSLQPSFPSSSNAASVHPSLPLLVLEVVGLLSSIVSQIRDSLLPSTCSACRCGDIDTAGGPKGGGRIPNQSPRSVSNALSWRISPEHSIAQGLSWQPCVSCCGLPKAPRCPSRWIPSKKSIPSMMRSPCSSSTSFLPSSSTSFGASSWDLSLSLRTRPWEASLPQPCHLSSPSREPPAPLRCLLRPFFFFFFRFFWLGEVDEDLLLLSFLSFFFLRYNSSASAWRMAVSLSSIKLLSQVLAASGRSLRNVRVWTKFGFSRIWAQSARQRCTCSRHGLLVVPCRKRASHSVPVRIPESSLSSPSSSSFSTLIAKDAFCWQYTPWVATNKSPFSITPGASLTPSTVSPLLYFWAASSAEIAAPAPSSASGAASSPAGRRRTLLAGWATTALAAAAGLLRMPPAAAGRASLLMRLS